MLCILWRDVRVLSCSKEKEEEGREFYPLQFPKNPFGTLSELPFLLCNSACLGHQDGPLAICEWGGCKSLVLYNSGRSAAVPPDSFEVS